MSVVDHPISKADEKLAESIPALLRKSNLDVKQFEAEIKLSNERLEALRERLGAHGTTSIPIFETEFHRVARLALEHVTIEIGPPVPMNPEVLNSLETARVDVTITNHSDLPLRDIVVELRADSTEPVVVSRYLPGLMFINPRHVASLKCNERKTLMFFIRAKKVGETEYARLSVRLNAEVIPFVGHSLVTGEDFPVYPS